MRRLQQAILPMALLLLMLLVAVFLAACGDSGDTPTDGQSSIAEGGEMRLTVVSGGNCTGNDCFADVGSTFTLAVEVLEVPESYVLLQTFINYGIYDPAASEDDAGPNSCEDGTDNWTGEGLRDGADRLDPDCVIVDLTYVPKERAADEIPWADLEAATAVRFDNLGVSPVGPGLLGHGGITGLIPPLAESTETGIVVQVEMVCSADAATVPISILLYNEPLTRTSGTAFVASDTGAKIVPKVTPITMHCVAE